MHGSQSTEHTEILWQMKPAAFSRCQLQRQAIFKVNVGIVDICRKCLTKETTEQLNPCDYMYTVKSDQLFIHAAPTGSGGGEDTRVLTITRGVKRRATVKEETGGALWPGAACRQL